MTDTTDTKALRVEIDTPGIGSVAQLRRLAHKLMDELEAERQRANKFERMLNTCYDQLTLSKSLHEKAEAELAALKAKLVPVDDLKAEIKALMRTYALVSSPSTMAAAHEAGYAFVKAKGFNRILAALFTAPQKPVVLSFEQWLESKGDKPLGWVREAMKEAYNAAIESAGGIVKDGE